MAKLTPEQIEQITAWAEKGKSGLWIASRLRINNSTVNYRMLCAGYDPWPGERRNNLGTQKGAFSPEEDEQMLQLGRGGMSPYNIAKVMRRPPTSIRIRILTLEVRAEIALEAAA